MKVFFLVFFQHAMFSLPQLSDFCDQRNKGYIGPFYSLRGCLYETRYEIKKRDGPILIPPLEAIYMIGGKG